MSNLLSKYTVTCWYQFINSLSGFDFECYVFGLLCTFLNGIILRSVWDSINLWETRSFITAGRRTGGFFVQGGLLRTMVVFTFWKIVCGRGDSMSPGRWSFCCQWIEWIWKMVITSVSFCRNAWNSCLRMYRGLFVIIVVFQKTDSPSSGLLILILICSSWKEYAPDTGSKERMYQNGMVQIQVELDEGDAVVYRRGDWQSI